MRSFALWQQVFNSLHVPLPGISAHADLFVVLSWSVFLQLFAAGIGSQKRTYGTLKQVLDGLYALSAA